MRLLLPFFWLGLSLGLGTSGCGGSSSSAGGSGGSGSSNGNTLSCVVTISGTTPQCQFYEASGKDAATVIAQLRAGCVDQAGAKAQVVDSCPTSGNLGGCKGPITVKGGAQATLDATVFQYAPAADAGSIGGPKTVQDVQSNCQALGDTYVPAP